MWNKITDLMPEKDKTVLVFGINEYGKNRTLRAFYAEKYTIEDNENEYGAAEYFEENDCYYLKEGFYERNEHEEINWFVQFPITHWMELPSPPIQRTTPNLKVRGSSLKNR